MSLKDLVLFFRRLMEFVGMGSGYNVAAATAKIEVRRGPFAVSSEVNGSNFEP